MLSIRQHFHIVVHLTRATFWSSPSKHEDCNRIISGVCSRKPEFYVFVCHSRHISHWLTILACKLPAVIFLHLPATRSYRPAVVRTEAGRDCSGEPRPNSGAAFSLRNIGFARSNIARTTIVLMKDMWMLLTARREYASGLCLSDTEKMRVVLTRCYIRPGFNVELHFYSNCDRSAQP